MLFMLKINSLLERYRQYLRTSEEGGFLQFSQVVSIKEKGGIHMY